MAKFKKIYNLLCKFYLHLTWFEKVIIFLCRTNFYRVRSFYQLPPEKSISRGKVGNANCLETVGVVNHLYKYRVFFERPENTNHY